MGVASLLVSVCLALACRAQTALDPRASPRDWTLELEAKYPGLLAEFRHLLELWQRDIQSPEPRAQSRLLPLLPEATMSYAAIPNYGATASQLLTDFRKELQQSSVLREWWKQGQVAAVGPKIEDSLDKFSQLSQYLGDEISISGTMEGRDANLLIVAEIRKPGLKKFLQQLIPEVAVKSKPGVRVIEPQELAAIETKRGVGELIILVRPDYVVGAMDAETLRKFNARLDQAGRGFVATPFGRRVAQAYADGLTTVAAADMQKILKQIPPGPHPEQMPLQSSGFSGMKYLVWEHTRRNGQTLSEAELSFTGPRRSAAAWLANPAPLGSLDFVSPKAILVSTVMLANPARIFDDVKEMTRASSANTFASITQMEQVLKLSLRDDVLNCLVGEITLELDTITPPKPAWAAILKVSDTKHLQQTLSSLLTTTQLHTEEFEEGGVTISTLTIPSAQSPITIGYAFVDGYWVIGSSREKVAEAIRLHSNGGSLGKSKKFLAGLPPGHTVEASALLYQDPIAMASLKLRSFAPALADSISQANSDSAPSLVTLYGEESAIREASRGGDFDVATVLVVAAIAIPNLLRSKMAANEASAVGTTRTVNTAQVVYAATYPERGYAPDLASLGPDPRQPDATSPDHANLMNETLANTTCTGNAWCTKSGYQFRVAAVCKLHVCKEYVVEATPVGENTGNRSFCSTSDGVIRYKVGAPLARAISVSECREWLPLQ